MDRERSRQRSELLLFVGVAVVVLWLLFSELRWDAVGHASSPLAGGMRAGRPFPDAAAASQAVDAARARLRSFPVMVDNATRLFDEGSMPITALVSDDGLAVDQRVARLDAFIAFAQAYRDSAARAVPKT